MYTSGFICDTQAALHAWIIVACIYQYVFFCSRRIPGKIDNSFVPVVLSMTKSNLGCSWLGGSIIHAFINIYKVTLGSFDRSHTLVPNCSPLILSNLFCVIWGVCVAVRSAVAMACPKDFPPIFIQNDNIKWKYFPRYWPFVRGIHRSPVNSPHKGQWRGTLIFSLICTWTNGWVNNRDAGDLRRHRTLYDVIVKTSWILSIIG